MMTDEQVKQAFQKLLDDLAREHEEPSEDAWDKKVNEGRRWGIDVAKRMVTETAKSLGVKVETKRKRGK